MYQKTIDGMTYQIDPSKLSKITFPFFQKNAKTAFYANAKKVVYLPIRYKLQKGTKNIIKLCAEMFLPKEYPHLKASCSIPVDTVFDAFLAAKEFDQSIVHDNKICQYIDALSNALYRALKSKDMLMLGLPYDYPSFLVQNGVLIGVGDCTMFRQESNGSLTVMMQKVNGPYLTAFQKEKDRNVHIVILDEEGEAIVSMAATVEDIKNNDIEASITHIYQDIQPFVKTCQDVYDSYHEEYLNYFLDREEENDSFEDLFD